MLVPAAYLEGFAIDPFKQTVFTARLIEDEPAVITTDGVLTYRALIAAVDAATEALDALHLDRKGLVAIEVKNTFFHVSLLLALGVMGIPSASILSVPSVTQSGVIPPVILSDTPGYALPGSKIVQVTQGWFASNAPAANYARLLQRPGFTRPDDLVRVAFSSGTTGFPKAVGLRYRQLQGRIATIAAISLPGVDRSLLMFGPSILDAYTALLVQFSRGAMLGFATKFVDALHLIRVFNIGIIAAPGPLLHGVLKAMEGRPPIPSLKALATGGARTPLAVLRETRQKLTPTVLFSYGSTEAGPVTYGTGPTIERVEGATGYLLPGVEMQVVDKEHAPLPFGQTGVIRVKTPDMAEYLNPTPDTVEMFRDGWFYPGDVGVLDESGQVVIVGRTTELINHGGVIVAPEFIEGIFRQIAGVKDVAAFGVINPRGLEEIWTALVLAAGADAGMIVNQVAPLLADKQPQRVVVVDAIPRGEMGKVKRAELRDSVVATQRGAQA